MSGGLKVSAPDGVQVGSTPHSSKLMLPFSGMQRFACASRNSPAAAW